MTTRFLPILVTIETDPTHFHGEHARPPALPGQAACDQILAHLSADLEKLFPGLAAFSIALPGAIYDQTEILRPNLPIFTTLGQSLSAHATESGPAKRLALTIAGQEGGDHPLVPDATLVPGVLQNLPIMLSGETEAIEAMAEEMEHRFMEQGQVSPHSAKALEAHFGVSVHHARFMTLTDLRALLKLQLEHFGFPGLWELLDAAIEGVEETVSVRGQLGQAFEYRQGSVVCRFETFDEWANRGSGSELDDRSRLADAYTDWTREFRQFVTTLAAHHVPLKFRTADEKSITIEADYLVETSGRAPCAKEAEVTEHSRDDLGVIAVTVLVGDRQFNYYPLSAAGLDALHRTIRDQRLGPGGFAYPGRLLYDPDSRLLAAERFTSPND